MFYKEYNFLWFRDELYTLLCTLRISIRKKSISKFNKIVNIQILTEIDKDLKNSAEFIENKGHHCAHMYFSDPEQKLLKT
jgi:hypothetical protein